MRHPHPNVWVFIDELKKIENAYSRAYAAYANGAQPRATPPAYLAQNLRIAEATELYITGEYTVLQFLQRASHAVMDAFVHPNDNDDPDDDVAHPPPPSPIGIPHLLEDPVEPIAEPRRRRRAPEDPIIENPQEVLGRGRRLVRGAVRGRSRARGRGRVRGRGLARGLVQGDQNEHRAHPQETIDEQFHRLQGIPVDDDGTVADPGEATCSTCLVNIRTYMIVPCSHIVFCGPCVRLHRQGMRNEAGELINFVVCPNCRIKVETYQRVYIV
ncbi:uncharacterized protein LOC124352670 [Homalodisca vitripennis]|uniref:uncharacterized protein LOC124352670 n=1 Tax=Homalodisca vitripennis TaxID=197043 RepID=UPI001EEC4441|nr:uncharacterized protein LOC124352670 [Homalodisca vitripennis]